MSGEHAIARRGSIVDLRCRSFLHVVPVSVASSRSVESSILERKDDVEHESRAYDTHLFCQQYQVVHDDVVLIDRRETTCLSSAWPVVPAASMHYHLFGVVLDVVALELDELVETKFAQRLSLARILPADPREILNMSVRVRG
jgi:hypothetical protein